MSESPNFLKPEVHENPVSKSTERQGYRESLLQQISIQFQFACKMAELEGISRADALLKYTQIYRKLSLERPLNSHNPTWRIFIEGLETAESPESYIVDFLTEASLKRKKVKNVEGVHPIESDKIPERQYGPFKFDYDAESKTVQLHIVGTEEKAPLSPSHFEDRVQDLKRMFENIRKEYPEAEKVIGGSWLFSVALGKGKILPPEFISSMHVVDGGFSGGNIWGQFLSGNGGIRSRLVQTFLENVKDAKSREELLDAIPYKNMEAECNIEAFYDFFDV